MKKFLKEIVSVANKCDEAGLHSEAEVLDQIFQKLAQEEHIDAAGLRWVSKGPQEGRPGWINWQSDKGHRSLFQEGQLPTSVQTPKAPAKEPGYFDSWFGTSEKPDEIKPESKEPLLDLDEQGRGWQKMHEALKS